MCVNERVSLLSLRDKPEQHHSKRFAVYADEVARADVKTLRSCEIIDRVVKAEETVAHGKKIHPIQIKLAT